MAYGFYRPTLMVRKLTREAPVTSQATLRILLRALFGISSRAECLTYLLTHDGGHPVGNGKINRAFYSGERRTP